LRRKAALRGRNRGLLTRIDRPGRATRRNTNRDHDAEHRQRTADGPENSCYRSGEQIADIELSLLSHDRVPAGCRLPRIRHATALAKPVENRSSPKLEADDLYQLSFYPSTPTRVKPAKNVILTDAQKLRGTNRVVSIRSTFDE
jgi:hypothetical protein